MLLKKHNVPPYQPPGRRGDPYLEQFVELLYLSFFLLLRWDFGFFEVYVLVIKCLPRERLVRNHPGECHHPSLGAGHRGRCGWTLSRTYL